MYNDTYKALYLIAKKVADTLSKDQRCLSFGWCLSSTILQTRTNDHLIHKLLLSLCLSLSLRVCV